MNVEFSKNFEKQIDRIRDAKLKEEIAGIVRLVIKLERLDQIPNVKKLKGFKSAYVYEAAIIVSV
jgi:hypothetical protein